MSLPSPEDPGRAPVWENYVVAQTVQASLGLIPRHALAVGVAVDGLIVRVRFQLYTLSEEDVADMDHIVDGLGALLGDRVDVGLVYDVLDGREISPHDGVRWIFLAR